MVADRRRRLVHPPTVGEKPGTCDPAPLPGIHIDLLRFCHRCRLRLVRPIRTPLRRGLQPGHHTAQPHHPQPGKRIPSRKRAFSLQELSQLFDLLDLEYERILDSGRNGALTHLRDTAAFKIAYAWGLRENEVRHLQIVDFSPNYRAPYFGDFGTLNVRWGKSNKGQAHKPRNVLTVFDWSAEVAEDWINQVLPRYGQPLSDLFPTNTGGIVSGSHLWRRMSEALDELGFPPGLDFHSLRRSYSTHLLTVYGYDLKFVSLQLGHEHAATTSIYTLPAPDFQITELARVHGETLKAAGAKRAATGQRLRLPPPPPLKNRKRT